MGWLESWLRSKRGRSFYLTLFDDYARLKLYGCATCGKDRRGHPEDHPWRPRP